LSYKPRHQSYAHQDEAQRRVQARPTWTQDVYAWLMEYGTGKSKVILDEWGERELAGELSDLLVVAPAGCYRNWDRDKGEAQLSQLNEHLSDDLRERAVVGAWVSGARAPGRLWPGNKFQVALLEHLLAVRDRPRVLVVNVEALSTVEKARELCRLFLARRRAMMVIDESTVAKGENSRRSQYLCDIGQLARARRIATGLVTPRSPLDLYYQFYFLDWRILGQRSFFGFRNRYAIMKEMTIGGRGYDQRAGGAGDRPERTIKVPVAYRNEDELRDRIAPHSYRVLKEDCLDLPPKIYSPIREVKMTDEQAKIYQDLLTQATSELASGDWVTATEVITRLRRQHQVLCGHVRDEEGKLHAIKSRRTDELLTMLQEEGGKAIIWCCYDWNIRELRARLTNEFGPGSVACFWGGNVRERGEEEARWLGDPDCRFMLSTQSAGGRGNTWIKANFIAYYASNDDLEQRMNSEDRAHRAGLKHSVTYADIAMTWPDGSETVDHKTIYAMRRKLDMATVINGDNYREWLV
jgi:SNF2-related domain